MATKPVKEHLMAKRSNKRNPDLGKTRFELRFDTDLYKQIQQIAEDAEISVNQFMQGISRWAVNNANIGEGFYTSDTVHGYVDIETREQAGCIWFGHTFQVAEDEDMEGRTIERDIPGEIYFQLDYTERHVVKDDFPHQEYKR